jgi:hypothetical protein
MSVCEKVYVLLLKLFFYGKGLKPMLRRSSGDLGGTKNQQVRKSEITPIQEFISENF